MQTWGVNFQRNIRCRDETAYWAPLPHQYNLFRLSMAGQLTGMRVPVGTTRNLKFTPYVVGEVLRLAADPDRGTDRAGEGTSRPDGIAPTP